MSSSPRTFSTASSMTAWHTSEENFGALAISSDSASASVGDRNFMTSAAWSSPTATRNAAALRSPPSLAGVGAGFLAWGRATVISVLAQPVADLGGDAIGFALHQLVELVHALVRLTGRQRRELRRAAGLELGEADRGLDLAQPLRLGQRLGLAPADVARHEEEDQQAGEADPDPLERTDDRRRHRSGLGRGRLGERHLHGLEDVAARRVDARGALDGLLQAGELGRRHRLVDHQRDLQLVDRAGRDLGLLDGLVDAEVGRAGGVVVAVVRAALAGAGRVGRDVGAGSGAATAGRAAAAQLL